MIGINKSIESAIILEMVRQNNKWGARRKLSNGTWHLILSEEVGEAAEAILKGENAALGHSLREELVQTTAVLLQWLMAIDEDRILGGEDDK